MQTCFGSRPGARPVRAIPTGGWSKTAPALRLYLVVSDNAPVNERLEPVLLVRIGLRPPRVFVLDVNAVPALAVVAPVLLKAFIPIHPGAPWWRGWFALRQRCGAWRSRAGHGGLGV